jgi:hypothetical protein
MVTVAALKAAANVGPALCACPANAIGVAETINRGGALIELIVS